MLGGQEAQRRSSNGTAWSEFDMKAFLLTAGLGTRLRPLTDGMPKCLLPICGKPLLEIWLELLGKHGVSEVLVNTHWRREKVERYIKDRSQKSEVRRARAKDRGRKSPRLNTLEGNPVQLGREGRNSENTLANL